MMFWIALSAIFLVALALLLTPLLRFRNEKAGLQGQARNLEVYKAQLQELAADRKNGLLGKAEADTARLEIERRLLKAAQTGEKNAAAAGAASRPLLITLTIVTLLLSVGFYLYIGMPGMKDFALKDQKHSVSQRAAQNSKSPEMIREVAAIRQHLLQKPDDVAAWRALGQYQSELDNRAAAAQAFQQWYQREPENIDAAVIYGESLIMMSNGRISPAALLLLNKAQKMQPRNPAVRHYLAMAEYQAGRVEQALAGWRQLAAESKPDVPWMPQLRAWIRQAESDLGIESADNGAVAPALKAKDRAAMEQMSAEEQLAMIKSMVGRLQDRMDRNPENAEGWLRLAKAYMVLNQKTDAIKSMEQALRYAPDELKPEIKKQLAILKQQG